MDKLEQSINRGKEAQRLLADPVLVEAFERLEAAYTAEWKQSEFLDVNRRESAFRMFTAMGDLKRQIEAFVTDGRISEDKLKRQKL